MPFGEDDDQDDTLDLTPDQIIDDEDQNGPDDEDDNGDDAAADDQADDDGGEEETVISFGDDDDAEDQAGDSSTIRRLRQQLREKTSRLRELETAAPKPQAIDVGEKPTLASCNYDEDAFEEELDAWKQRKEAADRTVVAEQEGARRANEAWQNDLQSYAQKKQAMAKSVPEYAEAEDLVISALNPMQQAVAVKAAQDPAALVVALSRSPAKLAELAKFDDPIKMAAAIARMEGTVKVVKRRKGPAPDRPLSGSGAMPGGKDAQLEKLEKEAEKSGDRTKLINYKRDLAARKAKK